MLLSMSISSKQVLEVKGLSMSKIFTWYENPLIHAQNYCPAFAPKVGLRHSTGSKKTGFVFLCSRIYLHFSWVSFL